MANFIICNFENKFRNSSLKNAQKKPEPQQDEPSDRKTWKIDIFQQTKFKKWKCFTRA